VVLPGRARWNDVGVPLGNVVGILAFQAVQQSAVSVEVIEVFKQGVTIALCKIRVRLQLSHRRCHFDGSLLVANCRFQRRVVGSNQPIDGSGLVLFHAHQLGQRHPRLCIHTQGNLFGAQGVELHTIHQNGSNPCKSVVVQLADGIAHHVLPRHSLTV
jgi:hypothetical protein